MAEQNNFNTNNNNSGISGSAVNGGSSVIASTSPTSYHCKNDVAKATISLQPATQINSGPIGANEKNVKISGSSAVSSSSSNGNSSSIKKKLIESDNKKLINDCDSENCIRLVDILKAFNSPISEEQAWAIIYQTIHMYLNVIQNGNEELLKDLKVPINTGNIKIHKDGMVHIDSSKEDLKECTATSEKKILLKLGLVVYMALDYNIPANEECAISQELEHLINYMTSEDIDEGIERDSDEIEYDEKNLNTKELKHALQLCTPRVPASNAEDYYKAVCRAWAVESIELKVFLQRVTQGDAATLRKKADAEASKHELEKLNFSDWANDRRIWQSLQARFWVQVVDELRRGVRLKKINFSRTSIEFELTPYEILMEDIRSRNYNLRKVMINGDVLPTVKKDAHAVILEFIRSRPPLRKASERKLPPLKQTYSAREQLLDSIRKGRVLKPVHSGARLKNRLLPTSSQLDSVKKLCDESKLQSQPEIQSTRNTLRLIPVDFSLLQDDDYLTEATNVPEELPLYSSLETNAAAASRNPSGINACLNNENNQNNINTVLKRTRVAITHNDYHRFCDKALETYDLATQCESRRASMRRHTIVGCQSLKNMKDSHSLPPSRPESRQSEAVQAPVASAPMAAAHSTTTTAAAAAGTVPGPMNSQNGNDKSYNSYQQLNENNINNLSSMDHITKNSLDENQWKESLNSVNERLSLTVEEIVHIRSVMTKAELESLPVEIKIKEDVEKRKVCFLCLRTRFTLFVRGVPCKLCKRSVCSKCYSKMRIPTEHFRNVPVVLLSPSLMNSPVSSNISSPAHTAHAGVSSVLADETFPRSLMERLMRPELDKKTRYNTVGSAPSSPKNNRSETSTPGSSQPSSMTTSLIGTSSSAVLGAIAVSNNTLKVKELSNRNSVMSRSLTSCTDGPRSLPPQSPARPHSNNSTLDRKNRFAKVLTLGQSVDHKDGIRGELMAVCNDCRSLVLEIIRSSRQTRSSARNNALRNLTLDLSPVYKRY